MYSLYWAYLLNQFGKRGIGLKNSKKEISFPSFFFEKKKREKKESHSIRIGRFKGKVFEQNTTRMGGDFVRNPKA